MLKRMVRFFWIGLTAKEIRRLSLLACTYLFIVGTYWLMRPLKDALFMRIVGKCYLPYAKIASVLIMIPLILIYSKLVDLVQKHRLFYIIFLFYAILFLGIAYFVAHPTIGLANPVLDKGRILGWVIYLSIESFGSLAVALFWSFVASTNDTNSAKKGYALIICGAQIGSVVGPLLARMASVIGVTTLLLVVVCGIMIVPFLVSYFVKNYSKFAPECIIKDSDASTKQIDASTGPIEGLRLLLSKPYLLGILGLITLYEIIGTIIDYQMKFLADGICPSVETLTELLGAYGFYANLLALVISLIGTSFLIRRLGLIFSLILFPTLVGFLVLFVWINPSLYSFFVAMIMLKGFSYALNKPCVEIMYIPTSSDIKFKAKSWIDVFGSRFAKSFGAAINAIFVDMSTLLFFGSIISLGMVGLWIVLALYVGKTNKKLVCDNKIIS